MPLLRDQRISLDLYWLGPVLLLVSISTWVLTGSAVLSLTAPVLLAASLLVLSIVTLRQYRSSDRVCRLTLGPLGPIDMSYVQSSQPGNDVRCSSRRLAALLIMSMIFLIPPLLLPESQREGWYWIPGLVVAGFAAVQFIPCLPCAGGYLLRDIFWFLHDDQLAGSRAAFLYSQITASALFVASVYLLIFHSHWLPIAVLSAVLGVYIVRCARLDLLRTTLIERASRVIAADALAGLNPTIRAAASIPDAIDILLEQRMNGPALVRDRNRYVGMLDLQRIDSVPRSRWPVLTARELIAPFEDLQETEPGATLLDVLITLQHDPASAVIVRERDGRIVGLVDQTMEPRALLRRGLSKTIVDPVSGRIPGSS
jgi:hypothetical protein